MGQRGQIMIEALESRVLLSGTTQVTNVVADNRGLVSIYFNGPLNGSTVNTSSVVVYLASTQAPTSATVAYGAGQNRIVINANLAVDTPYYVGVKGNQVRDINGNFIDGEYTGTLPSGNGVAGGNFRFNADVVPTNQKIAAFTIAGQRANVRLYSQNQLPLTIPNFLNYVNSGSYDGTIIHRTASTTQAGVNIVQGGAFYIQNNPVIGEHVIPSNQFIAEEPVFSNTVGTLAMARQNSPNTTSNQWYFNETDNTALDGGYSVFGAATNNASLAVIQNIFNNTQQLDLTTTIDGNGASRYGNSNIVGQLNAVPTFNHNATAASANPVTDFIIVSRVAIRNSVSPIVGPGPSISPQLTEVAHFAPAPASFSSSGSIIDSDSKLLKSNRLEL